MQEETKNEPTKTYDAGKERLDLLPWDILSDLSRIYEKGAEKYERDNWRKGMSWSRCFACAMRHLTKWFMGESIDPESGLSHLQHACFRVIQLMYYEKSKQEFDDRSKNA